MAFNGNQQQVSVHYSFILFLYECIVDYTSKFVLLCYINIQTDLKLFHRIYKYIYTYRYIYIYI